jgi:hypothetical protein
MTITLKKHVSDISLLWKQRMGKDANGVELVCKLHEKFKEIDPAGHNCFGCNLQHEVDRIADFLNSSSDFEYPDHFATNYLINLYLLTERIFEIKKIIGLPRLYKEETFQVFGVVKLWANFIKHPKAFILAHHPLYIVTQVTEPKTFDSKEYTYINTKFVKKYYAGEDANKYKTLFEMLQRNPKICVEYPDLLQLTNAFCKATEVFINIILENKVYLEILNDIGTLQEYFTNIDDSSNS